jgi:predicted ATPase
MSMRLHRLEIHNYKSLRNVAIEPTPLSVFVGPNAAGKTNLADAIDFLGQVYAWNLERAVSIKGGYDSICFRDTKRTVDPIQFNVVAEYESVPLDPEEDSSVGRIVGHSFEFKAASQDIQASYVVLAERLVTFRRLPRRGVLQEFMRVTRKKKSFEVRFDVPPEHREAARKLEVFEQKHLAERFRGRDYKSELILTDYREGDRFRQAMESLRVFQLDPRSCREVGIPAPTPSLDRSGRNLPVALDHLKKSFPEQYSVVLETARRIMPSLETIETDWTHNRALTLFIKERGVRRHWTSEDVSTGTIQAIALLVAVFDPRSSLVVIEEPENSVHPWALRNLVEAFRTASEKKQIMLTTHSPILIDQLKPEEVWVVRKPGTETKIDPLLSLDPSLKESWGQGKFTLSEYLDSGAVPEAVPAANS